MYDANYDMRNYFDNYDLLQFKVKCERLPCLGAAFYRF